MRQGQQRLPGCATNSEYAEIRPDECKRRSENLLAFKTHETDSLKLQLRRLMRVELVRCLLMGPKPHQCERWVSGQEGWEGRCGCDCLSRRQLCAAGDHRPAGRAGNCTSKT